MKKKRNWRAIFTWALFVFAVAYALPSAFSMPSWWPFQKTIRGGLDLAGGLELRYTVDWKQAIEGTTQKTAEALQGRIVEELEDACDKFEVAKERRLERERKVAEKKAMKNLLVSSSSS